MAGLGGAFSGLLGNAFLQQLVLYNLVGQIVGAAIEPFMLAVQQDALAAFPNAILSPQELAVALLRGALSHDAASAEAKLSGVNQTRFDVLALIAGNAPGPGDLVVALRRGIIDQPTYDRGIAQGNLRNEWGPVMQKLGVIQPSPQMMLEAELEGQLTHAEALQRYTALGGDPSYYDIMFNTQGQAPTPTQALELANRGIIPWTGQGPTATSYEQAFLEGPWRNKWEVPFKALAEYLPPPRTVVAMLRAGSITVAQATTWLKHQGLSDTAVSAYVADASQQKLQGTKDLTQTTIIDLYLDRLIPKTQAATDLVNLGYTTAEANYILAVADARITQRFLGSAVGRIHSRYVAWRIDKPTAQSALQGLNVDSTGISDLLGLWDIERTANTPQLSAAQIAKAYKNNILDRPTTYARLEQLGYSKQEAWLYVSQYLDAKDQAGPP